MKPDFRPSALAEAFRRLSPRERTLAALITATVLAGWSAALLKDFTATRERLSGLDAARQAQDAWLNTAPALDTLLAAKSKNLEAARALDAEGVMGRLEKLLAKSGLAAESARPLTRDAGPCRAHTVSLRAAPATLAQLVAFRRALDASGLPMAVTAVEIETGDAGTLRARLDITALQPK